MRCPFPSLGDSGLLAALAMPHVSLLAHALPLLCLALPLLISASPFFAFAIQCHGGAFLRFPNAFRSMASPLPRASVLLRSFALPRSASALHFWALIFLAVSSLCRAAPILRVASISWLFQSTSQLIFATAPRCFPSIALLFHSISAPGQSVAIQISARPSHLFAIYAAANRCRTKPLRFYASPSQCYSYPFNAFASPGYSVRFNAFASLFRERPKRCDSYLCHRNAIPINALA